MGAKKTDVEFTYIDVSAIDKAKGVISENVNVIQSHEAPSRARKIVTIGTIIYSTVRSYLLNIAIVDKKFDPEPIASTAFAVIHPFEGINNKYLYYYLRSQPFVDFVEAQMMGMAYPAINDGNLYKGIVPLPPKEEQHRIVTKVDRLMALCDELEARKEKQHKRILLLGEVATSQLLTTSPPGAFNQHWQGICDNFDLLYSTPENVSQLRQAILQLAVMGKLVPQDPNDEPASVLLEKIKTEKAGLVKEGKIERYKKLLPIELDKLPFALPNNWEWIKLEQVVISLRYGTSKKCGYEFSGVPVLRIPNLLKGSFEKEDLKFTHLSKQEFQELKLVKGNLLMVRSNGSASLVGRTAVVDDNAEDCAYAGYLVRIKLLTEYVSSKYLHLALETNYVREQIEVPIRTTTGVKNINSTEIANLVIPLPPGKEQKRIVAKVEQLMTLCDKLEAKLKQTINDREKLMETALRQVLAV